MNGELLAFLVFYVMPLTVGLIGSKIAKDSGYARIALIPGINIIAFGFGAVTIIEAFFTAKIWDWFEK